MQIAYFASPVSSHDCKWINHLSKNKKVIVICAKEGTSFPLLNNDIEVFDVLPDTYPLLNFFKRYQIIRKIKKILKKEKIEIVHSMYAMPNAIWAYHSKIPFHIVTTRGSDILVDYKLRLNKSESLRAKITNSSLKRLLKNSFETATFITSTSKQQKDVITEFIDDHQKLKIVRTGVYSEDYIKYNFGSCLDKTEINILCPRGMNPLYNIDLIIRSFKILVDNNPQSAFTLTLINYLTQKEYLSEIESLIQELGLKNFVTILPNQTHEGLLSVYNKADIVIMVPKSDGTPVSGIEAMLAKRPLILSPLKYDEDIFNLDTIWKIEAFTEESIYKTIEEVLDYPKGNLTKKLDAAFKIALKYADTTNEMMKIEDLYNTILKRTPIVTEYKICSKCILDTYCDPRLELDENGICNYCHEYEKKTSLIKNKAPEDRLAELENLIEKIKNNGRNKKYDCVLGVSGGSDSTYLAYWAKKTGLRPLLVHLDNGWNSEIAVNNIKNLATSLDLDLSTYVVDWEEFKDIQTSFLKASVVDIELVTDQAILAILYEAARNYNLKYILYGYNHATEAILPKPWYHWKTDVLNIEAIQKTFGTKKIKTYPLLGFFKNLYYTRILGIKKVYPLNYLPYIKNDIKKLMHEKVGWNDYGNKHHESVFTRFYQSYILPVKFNIDKRKAHLSSLICSGQITREEALMQIASPPFTEETIKDDLIYVTKKLGLSEKEFQDIMRLPIKDHSDYASYFDVHYKIETYISHIFSIIRKIGKFN